MTVSTSEFDRQLAELIVRAESQTAVLEAISNRLAIADSQLEQIQGRFLVVESQVSDS